VRLQRVVVADRQAGCTLRSSAACHLRQLTAVQKPAWAGMSAPSGSAPLGVYSGIMPAGACRRHHVVLPEALGPVPTTIILNVSTVDWRIP
jgi:hypothetical protein